MPNFEPLFIWLETSAISVWIVESPSLWAIPGILAAHTVGLGLLAGLSVALDLRLLGVAPGVAPTAFLRFLPVMSFGLWLNVISGLALVLGYPVKALTNPVFYLKLVLIAGALLILRRMLSDVRAGRPSTRVTKVLAVFSLVTWAAVITAGRLLAYTCSRLTVDITCR